MDSFFLPRLNMRPSIGVAATFRDEANALPGFLESASHFFDEIFLADCSPDLSPSTDGSLDIIRKWGLPDAPLWNLSAGFGAIRSQLIHTSKTDWTVVLDIDERMQVAMPILHCEGTDRYPAQPIPNLKVTAFKETYNHFDVLVDKIMEAERRKLKCVRFSRRHWFNAKYTAPCENWMIVRDFQLRCMKSRAGVGFTTEPKMHEKAYDFDLNCDPDYVADDPKLGPFIEHLHCHFKPMEPEQRKQDIAAYDALHHSDTHTPIPA